MGPGHISEDLVADVPRRGLGGLAALALIACATTPLRADGVCSLMLGQEEDEISAAMDGLWLRFVAALSSGCLADVEAVLWQPRDFLYIDRGRMHRGAAALFDHGQACRTMAPWSAGPRGGSATTLGLGDGVALTARSAPPALDEGSGLRRLDVLVGRRAPERWLAVAMIVTLDAAGG